MVWLSVYESLGLVCGVRSLTAAEDEEEDNQKGKLEEDEEKDVTTATTLEEPARDVPDLPLYTMPRHVLRNAKACFDL